QPFFDSTERPHEAALGAIDVDVGIDDVGGDFVREVQQRDDTATARAEIQRLGGELDGGELHRAVDFRQLGRAGRDELLERLAGGQRWLGINEVAYRKQRQHGRGRVTQDLLFAALER